MRFFCYLESGLVSFLSVFVCVSSLNTNYFLLVVDINVT